MEPLNGGTHGLMERLIRDTEETINKLRKRREGLEAELITLQEDEKEARSVLHLLKTGKKTTETLSPVEAPKPKRKLLKPDDYLEGIKTFEYGEFTAKDLGELVGTSADAARTAINRYFLPTKVVRVVSKASPPRPGQPTVGPATYKQLRPPV